MPLTPLQVTPLLKRTAVRADSGRLLTPDATARLMGVQTNLLRQWRFRNTGPSYVRYPGLKRDTIRYREDVVVAFIAEHEVWINRLPRLTLRRRQALARMAA